MNKNQRLTIIAGLCGVGFALFWIMLSWGNQYEFGSNTAKILVLFDSINPRYPNLTMHNGIYTEFGIAGVVLGVAVPICLYSVACFIYFGKDKSS